MTLNVSPDLQLPDDAVTETFAILAKRGAGKSNAAVVMAEQMHDAGLPWVAVDPKGDWWGVRSSADGRGPGLPVLVLGGQHADVPLEPAAGRLVADLIIEQRLTAVLDVSLMSKSDMRRFLADFAERLYLANTEPLHVFAEEAHEYIPQRVDAGAARMVGAWEKLVKWGRTHGLGVTLITQRSASLNKDVLTQVETLFALRTTGPQDQAAVKAWVDEHDDGRAVIGELRKLPSGAAFVLSPQWLGLDAPKRITFARRRTFDSGATPNAGEKRTAPRSLADVDLAAIKEAMAETIEKATADDPKALRERIRDLERQLTERPAAEPERVEVPVLSEDDRLAVARLGGELAGLAIALTDVDTRLTAALGKSQTPILGRSDADSGRRTRHDGPDRGLVPRQPTSSADAPHRAPRAPVEGGLSKAERAVLTAIVQRPGSSREVIGFLAQYSPKSSSFGNAIGALRSAGLVAAGQPLRPLPAADDAVGHVEPLPSGDQLRAFWLSRLAKAEEALLRVLIDAHEHGEEISRDELGNRAGYSTTSSSFGNALGRLRSLSLVGRGQLQITDDLADALGI